MGGSFHREYHTFSMGIVTLTGHGRTVPPPTLPAGLSEVGGSRWGGGGGSPIDFKKWLCPLSLMKKPCRYCCYTFIYIYIYIYLLVISVNLPSELCYTLEIENIYIYIYSEGRCMELTRGEIMHR